MRDPVTMLRRFTVFQGQLGEGRFTHFAAKSRATVSIDFWRLVVVFQSLGTKTRQT